MVRSRDGGTQHAVEIGRRLKRKREELDMTQRELADLLGVSERSVAAYERGEVIPYRFIRRLEEVLSTSAEWLLHGTESSKDDQFEVVLEELRTSRKLMEEILRHLEK